MATTEMNDVCCMLAPVSSDYVSRGTYVEYLGLKCYVTGDKSSKTAIIGIYDIFGYCPQTEQGADMLASKGNYVVLPDLLHGNPWPIERHPPKTPEERKELTHWFSTTGNLKDAVPETDAYVDDLIKEGFRSVGVYGLCWGGKIANLVGGGPLAPESIKAVGSVHPGFIDFKDGETLKVPLALFPSKNESQEAIQALWKAVQARPVASKSVYKLYDTVHHGWAGSRADLDDPENAKQFLDVYTRLGVFFEEHL